MAYNQSLLEQELKKGEEIKIGWPWRMMTFSAMLFLVSVAIFLGMKFGFKTYLKSEITKIDSQIEKLTQSMPEEQQKSFLVFSARANNIQKILSERRSIPLLISFLEKNTLKNIYYTSINLDTKEKSANMEGVAPDFNVLAQQMEIFRNASDVDKVTMGRSTLLVEKDNQGKERATGVNFSLSLKIKK